MKLVIDRKIWLRGEGSDVSKLLRSSDQKRCCVGIYLGACGVEDVSMQDVSDANILNFREPLPEGAQWLRNYQAKETAGDLYEANDYRICPCDENLDEHLFNTEEGREQRIKEVFLHHGVEVEFIN